MNGETLSPGRQRFAAFALLAVVITMAAVANFHQSLATWLVWKYAALWLLSLGFACACVSSGHLVVRKCLGGRLPLAEHGVLSFGAGLFVFATGVALAGVLGQLRGWFFVAWPLVLAAAGARSLRRHLQPRWQRWRRVRRLAFHWPRHRWQPVLWAFGCVGLLLVYLPIVTPANLAYDSRWYHLGVAEHYATSGRMAPFVEGWFHSTLPQFASWLYTWALLMPRAGLFFRAELCAHVEFVIFLATLVAVGVLVRWLSGGTVRRGAWVCVFLFPGLFLYDSNLSVAADHVMAFWGPALILVGRRIWQNRGSDTKGAAAVLGVFAAAATMTKYQAIYMFAGLALLFVCAFWTQAQQEGRFDPRRLVPYFKPLGLAVLVAALASSPHWLRNWIWYGNPVYPLAHGIFGGHPWAEGTVVKFEDPGWNPVGNLAQRIVETIGGTFSFGLVAHDWKKFHGAIPVFGALFPLLLLPALAVRGLAATWKLAAATLLGVLVWYATYHQDRYLQSLLPWMAGVVAVVIARLWGTRSKLVQGALVAVIAFQCAWGSDVPFLPTHALAGKSPFEIALHLASSTYRKDWVAQTDPYSGLPGLEEILPPVAESSVLLHEEHMRFGLGRPLVTDGHGRQGALRYKELKTPKAVHQALARLGVTHVLWKRKPKGLMLMTDDLVFHSFVRQNTDEVANRTFILSKLRTQAPSEVAAPEAVVFVTCGGVQKVAWDQVDLRWRTHFKESCDQVKIDAALLGAALPPTQNASYVLIDEDLAQAESWLPPGWIHLFDFKGTKAFARTSSWRTP